MYSNYLNYGFFILFISFWKAWFFYNPCKFSFLLILDNWFWYPTYASFNLTILIVGVYFAFLILCLAETKAATSKTLLYSLLILFILVIYLYISTNNLIFLFYLYEMFLVPSIYLVYYYSPNKRSLVATFYFLIWTQVGSFLVFISLIAIINYINIWNLTVLEKTYIPQFLKSFLFFFYIFWFWYKDSYLTLLLLINKNSCRSTNIFFNLFKWIFSKNSLIWFL